MRVMIPKKLNKYFDKKNVNIKYSGSKRKIDKYLKKDISKITFTKLYEKPYLRTILQLIIKSIQEDYIQTVEEFLDYIKDKLEISLDEPIFIDVLCKYCDEIIDTYEPYDTKKPKGIKRCPKCKNMIDLSDCEDKKNWECPESIMYKLLDDLNKIEIVTKDWYGLCPECLESSIIKNIKSPLLNDMDINTYKEYLSDFYCPKCGNLFEIRPFYGLNTNDDISFWKEGYWLEWYIKNICLKAYPRSIVEQGIILSKNHDVIEVDVLILKNNETYGIECKSYSPDKSVDFGNIAPVLKYNNFLDHSIFITTGIIKPQDVSYLKKNGVSIVNRYEIEKIRRYIK